MNDTDNLAVARALAAAFNDLRGPGWRGNRSNSGFGHVTGPDLHDLRIDVFERLREQRVAIQGCFEGYLIGPAATFALSKGAAKIASEANRRVLGGEQGYSAILRSKLERRREQAAKESERADLADQIGGVFGSEVTARWPKDVYMYPKAGPVLCAIAETGKRTYSRGEGQRECVRYVVDVDPARAVDFAHAVRGFNSTHSRADLSSDEFVRD